MSGLVDFAPPLSSDFCFFSLGFSALVLVGLLPSFLFFSSRFGFFSISSSANLIFLLEAVVSFFLSSFSFLSFLFGAFELLGSLLPFPFFGSFSGFFFKIPFCTFSGLVLPLTLAAGAATAFVLAMVTQVFFSHLFSQNSFNKAYSLVNHAWNRNRSSR